MNHELKLLVEWSSPWQEFLTAIRPALGRSPEPLSREKLEPDWFPTAACSPRGSSKAQSSPWELCCPRKSPVPESL